MYNILIVILIIFSIYLIITLSFIVNDDGSIRSIEDFTEYEYEESYYISSK